MVGEVSRFAPAMPAADAGWLRALVTQWQIIADLSFADLVLWVEDAESGGWRVAAQVRPTTGPTQLVHDISGQLSPARPTEGDVVSVRRAGREIALITRLRAESVARPAGDLETAYLGASDALIEMVGAGEFPQTSQPDVADTQRVGDGFIRLAADGVVEFASPNALSAYRRLGLAGDLLGAHLGDVTATLLDSAARERAVQVVLGGREATTAELANRDATVSAQVIPLAPGGVHVGAIVLLRDVTELRLRERELVSKDATIREIHHRVKNNLQTVAALLRLQGRRAGAPEARDALQEAERRVGSIALVHETLSKSFAETVEFDEIADRLLRSVLEVSGPKVTGERIGSFGDIPGTVATPLAMVLTELIQNAAQHAFAGGPGRLTVAANRIRDRLRVRVSDDGVGMPTDLQESTSLGLSIVSTLVESELGGSLTFDPRQGGGTTVSIELQL